MDPLDPLLHPERSKSDLGTIIERSGTKNYLGFIHQTSQIDPWILFYDQIFDYFSTHFQLHHPGDPDHSIEWEGSPGWPTFSENV